MTTHRKLGTLIGVASLLTAGLLGTNLAQASLIADGPGLVYDNVANVTWSSNGNLFATMHATDPNLISQIIAAVPTVHDTPNSLDNAGPGTYNLSSADFSNSGAMDWWGAMAWVKYLDSTNYLGHSTWMLPTTYDQTCVGNCTNSMLGELFYTGLGGSYGSSIATTHNASYNLFTNIQNFAYWSGTEYASNPNGAWDFFTDYGFQGTSGKGYSGFYSWAVLPGNAAATNVPEPASVGLLGIGMLGLMAGLRRHRRFG
ncbi:DUF1566 domain-containing protein [Ferrovum sp.]|jgi:hypothetical protein|uniref:Lcl domain-containing protein n=1 Tax=Ferrovum sp. TaxID=2609467 RepID=UPI0026321AAD|nr:DUF1566 domain-containing protein [Ferrovum sp.]